MFNQGILEWFSQNAVLVFSVILGIGGLLFFLFGIFGDPEEPTSLTVFGRQLFSIPPVKEKASHILIVVGLIMAVGGLVLFSKNWPPAPEPTPTPAVVEDTPLAEVSLPPTPTPTPTFTPTTASPTSSPTVPPTYTPTNTPGPLPTPVSPLAEIFPQVGDGEAFAFINKGGMLTDQYADTEESVHSGQYGLKLTYSMTGEGNGGWGVHWDKAPLGYFDASRFSAIEFWVIGAAGGETFQIGLKDTSEIEVKVESNPLIVVSASEWAKVRVDLGKFAGVDTASLRNVNLGFNRNHGAGSICIDDIAFVSP